MTDAPGPHGGSGGAATEPFPLGRQARIAVFASGRGSNLDALARAFPPDGSEPLGRVVLVVSNRPEARALGRARAAGIAAVSEAWTLPPKRDPEGRERFERRVQDELQRARIDLICLAGFLRVLSPEFTRQWQGRIVNVHPSLLPAFRGLHAQRRALDAGARASGCTIHLVDEGVDTGRILLQRRVPVLDGDTVQTLSERILREEHVAYPEAVRALLRGEGGDGPRSAMEGSA